ncbi:MAG TPA: hypothetical protein VFV41_24625 [Streptosporangiaceae bacterium]|nr:hypothetical protein [Streptosporangiaceae bacterium]
MTGSATTGSTSSSGRPGAVLQGTAQQHGSEPPGIRLGVVRGISYGLFGVPGEFGPQARELGAGLVRAYLYWGQIEPEPGQYAWDIVDALLGQLSELGEDAEAWITLCSSSPWATRTPTDFLPPSPARDQDAYAEFVRRVVGRCAGRVQYWQCDNEPSNAGLLWAGTAPEYVTQLQTMYRAVKDADPAAAVVLGGCGYDVLSSPAGSEQRQFYDHLADAGRDYFDLFSVHLYGDLASVPAYVETARGFMRAHGYLKPVVAGEHAGPQPFEFPEAVAVMQQVFAEAFAQAPATQSTGELAERAAQETPERRAMNALYDRMGTLPPRLQMFLAGCPAELEARRERIACRQLAARIVAALASGVRRTAYWNLAPEYPGPADDRQMMYLMIGKLPLLDYEDGKLTRRTPAADSFALVAAQLAGARSVTRAELPGQPSVRAFEVDRGERPPLLVLWDQRDAFDGEDQPPVTVSWPWPGEKATVTGVFGTTSTVSAEGGRLPLRVTDTPLFIS